MNVGENIRKIRKEKGLTQKQLGDILGISQAAIGQFESANANLKFETINKIAHALNVPIEAITQDENYIRIDHVTTALFKKHPFIKDLLIESILNVMGNDLNPQLHEMLFSDSQTQVCQAINSLIDYFLINTDLEHIQIHYRIELLSLNKQNIEIMSYYNLLNDIGKMEALKRLHELTQIPQYQAPTD